MLLLDLFFPKFCVGCKKWGSYICEVCKKEIEIISDYICPVCHEFVYPNIIHAECMGKNSIDGVMCVMKYKGIVKKIVKSIKYQLVYDIYKELSIFIKESRVFNEFDTNNSKWYLTPIPLHKNRLKMRGFNQALELARIFSKEFDYPIMNVLSRIKETKPQAQIHSKRLREDNIKGAFVVTEEKGLNGKKIILVDDVYTSGSTCLEAAKVLKNSGATAVFIWTLARD